MKIVAPITSINEVELLIQSGAEEFYMGYLDPKWIVKYSSLSGNRRENFQANFVDEFAMKNTISKIHSYNKKVAVTLNDRYTEEQYKDLKYVVEAIVSAEADALIIADLGILLKIREWGYDIDVHMSTGSGIYSTYTAKFYINQGIKRIIIPRQVTREEMIQIIKENNNNIEIEIFGMYGKDPFMDSFCRMHHGMNCISSELGACGCMRINECDFKINSFKKQCVCQSDTEMYKPYEPLNSVYVDGCVACLLPYLQAYDDIMLKVVGRGANIERKIKAIRHLKQSLDIINMNELIATKQQMCKKSFQRVYGHKCKIENCYYPQYIL